MTDKPSFIDLFCGAGGFSLGFIKAGMESKGAIDIDVNSCNTYMNNILPNDITKTKCADIRKLPLINFVDTIGGKKIDVLVGGPPCQGFSHIGRSKIASLTDQVPKFVNDPRNTLYKRFIKIAKILKPPIIVMENVRGIHTHKNGLTSLLITESFKRIGYKCEGKLLNAANYGVPQKRERIIFIGVLSDFAKKHSISPADLYPQKTHYMPPIIIDRTNKYKNFQTHLSPENEVLLPPVTVSDAFSTLPHLKNGGGDEEMPYPSTCNGQFPKKCGNKYLHDWIYSSLDGHKSKKAVYNHHSRNHRPLDIEIFKYMKPGMIYRDLPTKYKIYGTKYFQDKFKKLIPTKPSWTVVAHLAKDGYM